MPSARTLTGRNRHPRTITPRRVLARIAVRPPTKPSNGAQAVNAMLGAASLLTRRAPLPLQFRTVINWGNTAPIEGLNNALRIINLPAAIAVAVNKLEALRKLRDSGVRVPEFQTEAPVVGDRDMWLARTVLGGSGGEGIVVLRPGDDVVRAPLYTKYVRKTQELRIHVAFGRAIQLQVKLRERDNEQTADEKLIRNHDNGWVFGPRDMAEAPVDAINEAVSAVAALGLDFGAVDLIIAKKDNVPYVLEVNTAPGIESPTLKAAYEAAFKQELGL